MTNLRGLVMVEPGLFLRVVRRRRDQTQDILRIVSGQYGRTYGTVAVSDLSAIRLGGLEKVLAHETNYELMALFRSDPAFERKALELTSAIVGDPFKRRLILFQVLIAGYDIFKLSAGMTIQIDADGIERAFLGKRPVPRVALIRLDPHKFSEVMATLSRVRFRPSIMGRLPGDAYHIVDVNDNHISTRWFTALRDAQSEQEKVAILLQMEQNI